MPWTNCEWANGKLVEIKDVPKDYKVKPFRVAVSNHRTDRGITNDLAQYSDDAVQEVCSMRWKIEQFHRELKHATGSKRNQCRIKLGLLDDHLCQKIKNQSIKIRFA